MFHEKEFYTYIMSNKKNGIIYVGMTGEFKQRIIKHKRKYSKGFTNKYNLNKLVYYQNFEFPNEAITREKKIKNWNRAWKINLINDFNPNWHDLSYRFNINE